VRSVVCACVSGSVCVCVRAFVRALPNALPPSTAYLCLHIMSTLTVAMTTTHDPRWTMWRLSSQRGSHRRRSCSLRRAPTSPPRGLPTRCVGCRARCPTFFDLTRDDPCEALARIAREWGCCAVVCSAILCEWTTRAVHSGECDGCLAGAVFWVWLPTCSFFLPFFFLFLARCKFLFLLASLMQELYPTRACERCRVS
jgi:hypothetical protein